MIEAVDILQLISTYIKKMTLGEIIRPLQLTLSQIIITFTVNYLYQNGWRQMASSFILLLFSRQGVMYFSLENYLSHKISLFIFIAT